MNDRKSPAAGDGLSAGEAASQLRLLVDTGLFLARERDRETIVQTALDAGIQLSGASFGAFFDNPGEVSEPFQPYKLAGTSIEAFDGFPFSRATPVFAETLVHGRILRSDDITLDPRFGGNTSFDGLPPRPSPVRSLLAVPVLSRSGEPLGALLYAHSESQIFSPDSESALATVAAQVAVAMENASLAETLAHEVALTDSARQLQRETAKRLEQVFEAMTDGVALLSRDWRFTYLNRAGAQIVGTEKQVVGRLYQEVFPDAMGSSFEMNYARAMTGTPVEFVDYYAPLNVWASVRAFPTPEGIAVLFQDVTQQRRAESALAETARRLRQALDAGEFGTWAWNKDTGLIDFDERGASIFGTPPHTPVSRDQIRERMVVPEDLPRTPSSLRDVLASSGVYHAEYRIKRGGEQHWISAHGLATYNQSGTEVVGMTGTVQDITARKAQEATLRQSEKLAATGRLAATIAHEINNPLEAVTNLIYIAKTDPTVPPSIQRLLETADNELARVAQIAQQTLGFYRDTTRPGVMDLSRLIQDVVDLFERKLRYKKLTCRVQIASGLSVYGLPGEIRQVFSNLLVNAIEASDNAEILVRARTRSVRGVAGVSCLIADRGCGISAAVSDRLFSPFFTTKQAVGTGLGLWVTKGIVEKHGGAIGFRTCTEPPSGTVFRVFLPAENKNPEAFSSPNSNFLQ